MILLNLNVNLKGEVGPHLTQFGRGRGVSPCTMPSFILIHPTVWPQYTNVTDRQTGQQWSDSIGRIVLQMVAQKLVARFYRPDALRVTKPTVSKH